MRHVPELDGLRAMAVVAVVLFHAADHGPISGGFVGVDLFFVLSAFLITDILADGQSLKRFYWHRVTRLAPALLLMVAAYLALAPLAWPGYNHARDALLASLYVSDYSYTFWGVPFYLRHTWSLAIEEQFYLVWPAVVVVLMRAKRPAGWLAGAFVTLTLWRIVNGPNWLHYYYRLDTHATGLIAGAWLYFMLPGLPLKAWHGWAALALIAAVFVLGKIGTASPFITIAEIASAILIGSAFRVGNPLLRAPVLQFLGQRSYAIYLWHFPIAFALRSGLGFCWTATLTLASSIALASLSYVTVEKWGRTLRRLQVRTHSEEVAAEPGI